MRSQASSICFDADHPYDRQAIIRLSQYVEQDRNGNGVCPLHDNHVYSLGLNEQGNYWNCFTGCGGGSVIDFWMHWRKLNGQDDSFTTTITDLAKMLM